MDESYLEEPGASEFDHLRSSSGSQRVPVTDLEELIVISAPWVSARISSGLLAGEGNQLRPEQVQRGGCAGRIPNFAENLG